MSQSSHLDIRGGVCYSFWRIGNQEERMKKGEENVEQTKSTGQWMFRTRSKTSYAKLWFGAVAQTLYIIQGGDVQVQIKLLAVS